ncbi:MAG: NAD(P)-binding protein [Snowella sp.]|nr:NAD(P)-binding protein [Snowella sp.]
MKPRIIVCGLGKTGYKIFSLLKQQGAEVVGISDRDLPGANREQIVFGELRSPATLSAAKIQSAHTLVLATSDDALNLAILTQARILNPKIRIINRLFNQVLGERLDQTLTDHVSLSVSSLAAPIFSFAALGNKAIGQLRLFNRTWPIQEVVIDEHHPWLGLKLGELWDDPSRMLIYYLHTYEEMNLVTAIAQNQSLLKGDHLIIGVQPQVRPKSRSLERRLSRFIVNLRQYQRYVRPVLWVSLCLLLMIATATLTYAYINHRISLVDALYFSVGMITGAGGKEEVAEHSPDVIKIFTAIMMVAGAGVIGICYALLNDFILGSRFKQFLDAARVPTRNHYIVCGLGSIGMAIVQQLHSQGHEVVVIESDTENRFRPSARSLGVPVIVEDARVESTLKAANITKAESIIVVTSSDMVNLEIALTAKAIAPKLTVVLRSQDAQFSESVQEVFDFDAVLCPAELATYSFAAAALGGKILGNGMTDDLLWVALATLITENHPFFGKTVKEAAMVADFVPLYLERAEYTIHSWELLAITLNLEDVLYLTIPATKLDQLWRSPLSEFRLNEESII